MVAQSQMLRHLHPELPRGESHTAAGKGRLTGADVGNNALLHLLPDSIVVGKDTAFSHCLGSDLAHSFVQDVEKGLQRFEKDITPEFTICSCLMYKINRT